MSETNIRKVGNQSVMKISAEMLAVPEVKEGDTEDLTCSDENGLNIQAHDPALLVALAAAEEKIDKNRTLLPALS